MNFKKNAFTLILLIVPSITVGMDMEQRALQRALQIMKHLIYHAPRTITQIYGHQLPEDIIVGKHKHLFAFLVPPFIK